MRLHEVATFKTTKTTKVGKSAKDGAPAAGKEGLAAYSAPNLKSPFKNIEIQW